MQFDATDIIPTLLFHTRVICISKAQTADSTGYNAQNGIWWDFVPAELFVPVLYSTHSSASDITLLFFDGDGKIFIF